MCVCVSACVYLFPHIGFIGKVANDHIWRLHFHFSCAGFIQEVANDHLWVHVSPSVRGRVAQLEVSQDMGIVSKMSQSFTVGDRVNCVVAGVNADKVWMGAVFHIGKY